MDERVRARLVDEAGHKVPFDGVSGDGLALFGESSAWPRRAALRVTPLSPGTKENLKKLRRRHGWGNDEIQLDHELVDGEILLRGIDPGSLPPGIWEFGLNVYDVISRRSNRVDVRENEETLVEIRVANDVKELTVRPESTWDPEIRRVLSASELDASGGLDWATRSDTRANRRACALNVLAVCRELGIIEPIRRLFLTEVDRIYAEVDAGFEDLLGDAFHEPRPPAHPVHRKLLEGLEPDEAVDYDLLSFRQKRNPSLQVVTATPKADGPCLAELDIDLGDVLDPFGFFIHMVEVLHPKRTDHLVDVKRMLLRTGAKPFLAYETG